MDKINSLSATPSSQPLSERKVRKTYFSQLNYIKSTIDTLKAFNQQCRQPARSSSLVQNITHAGGPPLRHAAAVCLKPGHDIPVLTTIVDEKTTACKTPRDAKDMVEVSGYNDNFMNSPEDKQQAKERIITEAKKYIPGFPQFYTSPIPGLPVDNIFTWLTSMSAEKKQILLSIVEYITTPIPPNHISTMEIPTLHQTGYNLEDALNELCKRGLVKCECNNNQTLFTATNVTRQVIPYLRPTRSQPGVTSLTTAVNEPLLVATPPTHHSAELPSTPGIKKTKPTSKLHKKSAFGITKEEYATYKDLSTAMRYFSRHDKRQLKVDLTLLTHIQQQPLRHNDPQLFGLFNEKYRTEFLSLRLDRMMNHKVIRKQSGSEYLDYYPTEMTEIVIRGLTFKLAKYPDKP